MPYIEYDEVAASCPECGRNFRSEEDLEAHMEEVHARVPPPANRLPPVGRSHPPNAARRRHHAPPRTDLP